LSGQNLTAGALLGKIELAMTATVSAVTGTGNGTFTLDATTPVLVGAKAGTYRVTCIQAATDSGTFQVSDPDGKIIGIYIVGQTFANQIKFVIADGAADFAVGAFFVVTVAAGSGKLVICDSTNLNGSEKPYAVLLEDCNATSADKTCLIGLTGEYNSTFMTFGGTDVLATHFEACEKKGIYIKTGVVA
jgi:hypothetical protein